MRIPEAGHLIRYSYLWRGEAAKGQEEGLKDRPCAVVSPRQSSEGATILLIAPVTHTPPEPGSLAVEIPPDTKQRLGLDDARSWIVTNEVNRFTWPGPDIRPSPDGEAIIGRLPDALIRKTVDNVRSHIAHGRLGRTSRDDSS